jgi:hypothetical protein
MISPGQAVMSGWSSTTGLGFTVISNRMVSRLWHPFLVPRTLMVPVKGNPLTLFPAGKGAIVPVPEAPNPMDVLLLNHCM